VKYVVVDIETTGGKPDGNSITEIGVVHVEHHKITHTKALYLWRRVISIYLGDDYLNNEEWVKDHFITVSPSPTINSIGMKLAEERPNQIIEL